MRKIEQQMIAAINERRDWRLDNTEVQVVSFPHGETTIDRIYVRLHGSTIAIITPDELDISDCSWQTPTTKSRLNALLHTYSCIHTVAQVSTRRITLGTHMLRVKLIGRLNVARVNCSTGANND